MKYFSVKNFDKFQRYKDRRPPWIKLYSEILDDYEFSLLPDISKSHLILIWVLASQLDNKVPLDSAWISPKIGAKSPINLQILLKGGWIVPISHSSGNVSHCNKSIVLASINESNSHPETETYKQETETDKPFVEDSDEFRLSSLLFDLIKTRNPNHKQPDLKSWSKHINLLMRVDGRSAELIEKVIRWSQADAFWQNNILSTQSLRKQFDRLFLKIEDFKPEPKPHYPKAPAYMADWGKE